MRIFNVDVEFEGGPIENVFVKAERLVDALGIVADLYEGRSCISVAVDDIGELVN